MNGELKEEVYMEQPEGCYLAEGKDFVCKLKMTLYELKQTPRAWYTRLDHYIQQQGFKNGVERSNLYMKMEKDKLLSLLSMLMINFFLAMMMSDEHQYCSKNATTPGATKFTLSTRGSYKIGGDSAVYTSRCNGCTLCHC